VRIWAAVWNRARVTAADSAPRSARSLYRVRRAYFARALGRTAIVTAVLVLLVTVCLAVPAPGWLTALLVVLTAVAMVVASWIAVSVMLPPTLLQLDEQGFRVSKRYSSGPRQRSWWEVQNVASQQGPQGWALIMQHDDGEYTAVPLSLAAVDPVRVEQDVRDRLNEAHGYRKLP
jgi:hypothetical protein